MSPSEVAGNGGRPLSVLLADDEELMRSTMEILLQVLGCEAEVVESGEAALARLEAGCRPDLVILDLNMPGLGGAGTLARLRLLDPVMPVLLATGQTGPAAEALVGAYTGVSLLQKPFDVETLRRQIEASRRG